MIVSYLRYREHTAFGCTQKELRLARDKGLQQLSSLVENFGEAGDPGFMTFFSRADYAAEFALKAAIYEGNLYGKLTKSDVDTTAVARVITQMIVRNN